MGFLSQIRITQICRACLIEQEAMFCQALLRNPVRGRQEAHLSTVDEDITVTVFQVTPDSTAVVANRGGDFSDYCHDPLSYSILARAF